MSSSQSTYKGLLAELLADAGVAAWGVAKAGPVDSDVIAAYDRWIAGGCHGEMRYMERWRDVRADSSRLLDSGARSIISCAFAYPAPAVSAGGLRWAAYARGADYHAVLRHRLMPVAERLAEEYDAECRVCVDSAPIFERYYAVQAGVGFIGCNGMLIVPGCGSYVLLAEIVTTLDIEPDEPCTLTCEGCSRCERACPRRCLSGGEVDASQCMSYLTIEYRGEQLPESVTPGSRIYGCDICQEVCPHNADVNSTPLAEFMPRSELEELTPERISTMTGGDYKRLVKDSAIARASLKMIKRNLRF